MRSWLFGFRNWLAMILALYVAFWLQLESASSAAVCVGILALPTRGQALQKALYRFAATVIGVAASLLITGLFNGQRELFLVAFAAWLGICVFAAGLLDGNRAYGAVLSGYTVAVVAVAQIDSPQSVFDAGVNRGAAITIGILAIAFVNDVFAAPDVFPGLSARMDGLRRPLRQATATALKGPDDAVRTVAAMLGQVTALRPDITALSIEGLAGRRRAASARRVVTSMVRQLVVARGVAFILDETHGRTGAADQKDGDQKDGDQNDGEQSAADRNAADRSALADAIEAGDADAARASLPRTDPAAACAMERLLDAADRVDAAFRDMQSAAPQPDGPNLPIFRSPREAARNGVRTFFGVLLAAALLSLTGWPSIALALTLIGTTLGLSATNPNPKAFALAALITMPVAVVITGITEFVVLDGSDDFLWLGLGMAPPVMLASLMLGSGKPKLAGPGFLLLVFFPVLLSPSNPQSYDPTSYLDIGTIAIVAVIALFIVLATLLPTTDAMRRAWLLRSAEDQVDSMAKQGVGHEDLDAAAFRDATRVAQFGALAPPGTDDAGLLRLVRTMDVSTGARMAAGLDAARAGVAPDPAALQQAAMDRLDGDEPADAKPGAATDAVTGDMLVAASLLGAGLPPIGTAAPGQGGPP